jgi:hypothetical protein
MKKIPQIFFTHDEIIIHTSEELQKYTFLPYETFISSSVRKLY